MGLGRLSFTSCHSNRSADLILPHPFVSIAALNHVISQMPQDTIA